MKNHHSKQKLEKYLGQDFKEYLPVLGFSCAYILAFGLFFLTKGNYEFLWYVLVMVVLLGFLLATLKYTKLSPLAVWGLSIWGFLHMAGGSLPVAGDVLYAYKIFPFFDRGGEFFILKFDQVVHFFGFAVATLVMYEILKSRWRGGLGSLLFVAGLTGIGLGALNEIVEFMAVVFLASSGVGGYFNTGLDLVFNGLGALLVVGIIFIKKRVKNK